MMNALKNLSVLSVLSLIGFAPVAAAEFETYPLDYFALRAVESNVTVSPDGEHLAMLRIIGKVVQTGRVVADVE